MSKYTTQLRFLIDTEYDLGLKDYPIYDENYRAVLNKKILDHYRFREIGFETAALFKHYLNTTMNEIMPRYNVLYTNQLSMIDKDIFTNYSLTEELERNAEGVSESTSSSIGNGKSKSVFEDTPQGELVNADIDNYKYASTVSLGDSENTNSINDNSVINNTENYIKRTYGNIGVRNYAEDLGALAKNLMNIDLDIINDLNTLFMGIY